jgi:hypothetical protein
MKTRASCRAVVVLLCALAATATSAGAAPLGDDGGAEWQVEQPLPPPPETPGVEPAPTPVSLGPIGDVEFYAPNRGALITAGNGGSVKAGVWFYDGTRWRELSNQCGASDGRIAWAGPDEFWTVSDGRAGQALASATERPPVASNTLCHFAPGPSGNLEIVGSYASVPFQGNSYQAMHAAACLSASDCWFAGDQLPAPQIGSFMLHWNGATLEPSPYLPEGHPVEDVRGFEGALFWSWRLRSIDRLLSARPPALLRIKTPASAEESPFESAGIENRLLYSPNEFSTALDYLHLSVGGDSIWAGAGAQVPGPAGSRQAGVTIERKLEGGEWTRVLGPVEEESEAQAPPGQQVFPEDGLDGIAAEPGTNRAWLALDSEEDINAPSRLARALVARIDSEGAVSDRLELPLPADPHGALGAAQRIVCPATHDCWVSTVDGWLLHLATPLEREGSSPLSDSVFARIQAEEPITFRPADAGVPQEPVDELPEDNSGEASFTRNEEVIKPPSLEPAQVPVALLTHVRARVVHRTTLVLSFHLAVKATVRLLAVRHRKVVAHTAKRTLRGGNRSLTLKLNPKRWPEHLKLQTHALAPLPTKPTTSPNINSVSTSFVAPSRLLSTGLGF